MTVDKCESHGEMSGENESHHRDSVREPESQISCERHIVHENQIGSNLDIAPQVQHTLGHKASREWRVNMMIQQLI